ncbi:MAG: hypothetical protein ABGW97_03050 [Christiangramia sp.]|uniref:hypothetical protein n=1 Tax=Christiangramia sp. TaxID=1931228 RepID=UPI003242E5DE
MDIPTAYQFLKPHLKNYSQKERRALARLIEGEPMDIDNTRIRSTSQNKIKGIAEKKRLLLKKHFKN